MRPGRPGGSAGDTPAEADGGLSEPLLPGGGGGRGEIGPSGQGRGGTGDITSAEHATRSRLVAGGPLPPCAPTSL